MKQPTLKPVSFITHCNEYMYENTTLGKAKCCIYLNTCLEVLCFPHKLRQYFKRDPIIGYWHSLPIMDGKNDAYSSKHIRLCEIFH